MWWSPHIPALVHQVWLDFRKGNGANPTSRCLKLRRRLMRHNPGVRFWLWKDADIEQLIRTRYPWAWQRYEQLEPIEQVDMCRYAILHAHGGLALDMDIDGTEPLANFFREFEAAQKASIIITRGCSTVVKNYANGILFACPGHPFMLHILRHIVHGKVPWWTKLDKHLKHLATAGPFALAHAIRSYKKQHLAEWKESVYVTSPPVFLSFKPDASDSRFLRHYRHNSWMTHSAVYCKIAGVLALVVVVVLLGIWIARCVGERRELRVERSL